jgi:DNA polymerase
VIKILFYDFEVFKHNWLVVALDMSKRTKHVIWDDPEKLESLYSRNKDEIWVGYNSRRYDQFILKGILLGLNPKEINDWIIVKDRPGWQFSSAFNSLPLINYDVMPNPPIGLKTLEGFMGNSIKESDVPFDIDRPLTGAEKAETEKYCTHDVEQTVEVFIERKADLDAMMGIVTAFDLPVACLGNTEAQITSKVLDCVKQDFRDEFDYFFLPCIRLNKYSFVMDWFDEIRKNPPKTEAQAREFYKQSFEVVVAGVPHQFGFGGLHGAPVKPIHKKGLILHVDVGSYYPSMLIAWNLVTRASKHPEKYKGVYDTRMALKRAGKKKEQAPYKKLLNALSGAMKDKFNSAYDPRNNNCMCINGQLMLLDLIEHLEVVPGFELIQSNTDGLIIWIPDTDEAFDMVDDICYEWEQRCSTDQCKILLGLDVIDEIYQKDVNNYLWVNDGKIGERKGAYVKELSRLDADLPIINKALIDYMVKNVPVRQTVLQCDDLLQFQKLVKLSDKFRWVEHNGKRYTNKSYRVFASKDPDDGQIKRCDGVRNPAKFGNTPDHCFIENGDVNGMKCPNKLDKEYYMNLAEKRLKDFGVI